MAAVRKHITGGAVCVMLPHVRSISCHVGLQHPVCRLVRCKLDACARHHLHEEGGQALVQAGHALRGEAQGRISPDGLQGAVKDIFVQDRAAQGGGLRGRWGRASRA